MLNFSVGWQDHERVPFSSLVETCRDRIEEVYFPWTDIATGRSMAGGYDGYFDYSLQERLMAELRKFRTMGIGLDLLFNANCYGEEAMSQVLQGRVYSILDHLGENGLLPEVVTTTSPAIAHMIRQQYEGVELKASVNMKIGSVKGMQYVAHLFDSYCVAKECNRDLPRLKQMKDWAEKNGKKLTILANSGCMRDCSGQIFHDNMVAHEAQIAKQKNVEFLPYMCWNFLKNKENWPCVLQNTWIRPEDVHRYEGLAHQVKLATRAHRLPGMVMDAYARGRYSGNLLDLFEPGFGDAFAPWVVDSSRLPEDFWEKTTACGKNCEVCDYCSRVLNDALVFA